MRAAELISHPAAGSKLGLASDTRHLGMAILGNATRYSTLTVPACRQLVEAAQAANACMLALHMHV